MCFSLPPDNSNLECWLRWSALCTFFPYSAQMDRDSWKVARMVARVSLVRRTHRLENDMKDLKEWRRAHSRKCWWCKLHLISFPGTLTFAVCMHRRSDIHLCICTHLDTHVHADASLLSSTRIQKVLRQNEEKREREESS